MATEQQADPKSPEVMSAFYSRLYPFKSLYTWLSHTPVPISTKDAGVPKSSTNWTHREFAFTLQNDAYLRYNSFQEVDDLKKQIMRLIPSRFEIGAVYNARPKDKKTLPASALQPLRRELVFDIDMTDYDAIRTCCTGGAICRRCWAFISAAVSVLDTTLRRDFGYQLLLWVYSGRRGIHCWVSDESAMVLTDDQRRAIMGWLEVVKGGKDMVKKVNVRVAGGLPPSLQSSLDILNENHFMPIVLEDQDCFGSRQGWETLLELLPDREVVSNLRKKWEDEDEDDYSSKEQSISERRWNDLRREVKAVAKGSTRRAALMAAMEDIVLQYTYPRIDAEVTKHRNHLLKAPFCIHPSTGRVCVPVDPKMVKDFVPEDVPTVGQLLGELDALGTKTEDPSTLNWEHTSLKPYVDMMDEHNRRILQAERERKQAENRKDMSW
ncbi:DNA primase small subunit; AltName: Full=DNA polymerase subunit A; AltName: Full=DNA primase 50 kDa subunit; Short=dPRI50 [Serendipita indica DSM 11827]|nr:DNA primase small subunit; AltName: Full=DNA polymerase subunit A; AltName: Full=DNA primase 50 kDa subunit; Short=dPRI50 [Serendipita indica DSM 11827]